MPTFCVTVENRAFSLFMQQDKTTTKSNSSKKSFSLQRVRITSSPMDDTAKGCLTQF